MVTIFVHCFHYGVLPAFILFGLVSGLSLSIYSFKIFLFLVTGVPSTNDKAQLPQSLLCTAAEVGVGVAFVTLGSLIMACYTYYVNKNNKGGRKLDPRKESISSIDIHAGGNPFDRGTDGEGEIEIDLG